MQHTAPVHALRRFEECKLLERLGWAWTFDDLRHMRAGDVAFLKEYLLMTQPLIDEAGANGTG